MPQQRQSLSGVCQRHFGRNGLMTLATVSPLHSGMQRATGGAANTIGRWASTERTRLGTPVQVGSTKSHRRHYDSLIATRQSNRRAMPRSRGH